MKAKLFAGAATFALLPAAAMAVGLDRSGQPIDLLFEEGNYFEFTVGRVFPNVEGEDLAFPFSPTLANPGGAETGNVAEDFTQVNAGVKFQVNNKLSFALIADQPYGADVDYPGDGGSYMPLPPAAPAPFLPTPASEGSNNLGGTYAMVDSSALTALGRYKIDDNFSVHGGLRYQRLEAQIGLNGYAYGPFLSGYTADFEEDYSLGYVVGAAYERPELALRVALTYFSGIEHDLATTETAPAAIGGATFTSTTQVETPEAINLDFQTGLNKKTLLFGQIRYAWYEHVKVAPPYFDSQSDRDDAGTSLTDIDNNYSVSLGIGRKLTDSLSGSITFGYEPEGDDDLVSPLAPTNGQKSIGLGLSYAVNEQVTIAGGVRYVDLGDAMAETGTPDTARANFEDNNVVGVGFSFGYRF